MHSLFHWLWHIWVVSPAMLGIVSSPATINRFRYTVEGDKRVYTANVSVPSALANLVETKFHLIYAIDAVDTGGNPVGASTGITNGSFTLQTTATPDNSIDVIVYGI